MPKESFDEYRARVLGYLGKREPLRVLSATPARLERLVRGVPRRALGRRPRAGKWSIAEILAHMADAELAIAWRFRTMLATPGERLAWFDEHLWSDRLAYARVPPALSLASFRALRTGNLALLRSVPRSRWKAAFGVHDKRGRQTVADFVRMEAAHDLNHSLQIERLLRHDAGR